MTAVILTIDPLQLLLPVPANKIPVIRYLPVLTPPVL